MPDHTTCKIDIYKPFGDGPLPAIRLGVLADHDDITVLNKPPCQFCMQGSYHVTGYPNVRQIVEAFWPGNATNKRIDGTTSGVYLAGLKGVPGRGLSLLAQLWTTPAITKDYLAVISEEPSWGPYTEATIPITNPGKGTTADCTTGLKYLGNGLVIGTLLKGGRYHQVRQALKSVGTPIVGDRKYGGTPDATRPLLHAWRISIDGWGVVRAPTPDDMPDYESDQTLWSCEVLPITRAHQLERQQSGGSGPLPTWTPGRVFDGEGVEISLEELGELRETLRN